MEVKKLEERVQIRSSLDSTIATFPQRSFQVTQTDPQLAIAQTRVEVERELFRFSQLAYEGDKASLWSIADQINQHQLKARIESDLAERLRTFVKLSNEIIHGAEVADETKSRLASIGSSLLAKLHYKRKLFELEQEFAGHGLWHFHKGVAPEKLKYYYWSAVAGTLPEFDYNYELYREAAERHNAKYENSEHRSHCIYVLSLDEFVKVLEFREDELLRILRSEGGYSQSDKANSWQWPEEWGVTWNGPIVRERLSRNAVEYDLMQTRQSLNRYRSQLINRPTQTSPPNVAATEENA